MESEDKKLLTISSLLGALGLTRASNQINVNPDNVDIIGGTTKYPKYPSVFNSQRDAWNRQLASIDINTRSKSFYDPIDSNYINKRIVIEPDDNYKLKAPFKGKAGAEIHVGSDPRPNIRVILDRILTGKPIYRVGTDYGPGPFQQPYTNFNSKNWMRAPRGPVYTRNIVPGGDSFSNVPKATLGNINVSSIPVNVTKSVEGIPKDKNTKRILMTAGSGVGWPHTLPNGKKDLDSIYNGLKKTYGKNFELVLVEGPNNPSKALSHTFKNYGRFKRHYKYIPKTDTSEDLAKIIKGSDIVMTLPGSTLAEISGIEGYKPKILSILPKTENRFGHFLTNTKWFNNTLGGASSIKAVEFDSENVAKIFQELETKSFPIDKSISLESKDLNKIKNIINSDIKRSKIMTAGILAAALGGAIKSFDKKAEMTDNQELLAELGIAGGIAGVNAHFINKQTKKDDSVFSSFEKLKGDVFKNTKKGDVLFFNNADLPTPLHPIVVLDTDVYDYAEGEKWKTHGFKKTTFNAPPDPDRPHRLVGRMISFGPEGAELGSLEGYLHNISHNKKKVGNETISIFDEKSAKRLRGIYRNPEMDISKLDSIINKINKYKENYKYTPIPQKYDFNLCGKGKGTCIGFTSKVLKETGAIPNTHILPESLEKQLKIHRSYVSPKNLKYLSPLTPILAAPAIMEVAKGEDMSSAAILGGGAVAATAIPSVRKTTANLSEFATGMAGSSVVGGPPIILSKLVNAPKISKQIEKILGENPKLIRNIGAAALSLGGLSLINNKLNKEK